MKLAQLQDEVVNAAHCEGSVDPVAFAGRLLHDPDDVQAAISDLVNRGLVVAAEGDTYRLTNQGEAVHQARERALNDAVKMNTRTWQSR